MSFAGAVARSLLDGAVLGPTFPLRHVSHLMRRKLHTANIRRGGKVTFRPDASDAETFIDIFRHGAYDFSWLQQYARVLKAYRQIVDGGQTPLVIDAGANVGAASAWFAHVFPEAHIFAVEPDAANLEILRINAARRPRVEVIAAAVGSQPGRVSLINPDARAWSVQTARDSLGTVPIMTIPEIRERAGAKSRLFLVKVDIEGFEADLFESNLDWLDEVEVLIVEPHDWLLPGAGTSKAFQTAMLARDFETIISGENLIYLRIPR